MATTGETDCPHHHLVHDVKFEQVKSDTVLLTA